MIVENVNPRQADPAPPGPAGGVLSRTADVLLAVLFGVFLVLALLALFYRSLVRELNILPLWGNSEAAVASFISSLWPLLLLGLLWLAFLLLILLKNRRSGGRQHLQLGLGLLAAAVIGFFLGLAYPALVAGMGGDLRNILLNTAEAIGSLLALSALVCLVLASVFLSVYLVMRFTGRRTRHE